MKAIMKLVWSRLSLKKSNPQRAMVVTMALFLGLPGGMIAGTSAIKSEIENGPNRALTLMQPDLWVLQKGSTNVITSSFVPRELVAELNQIEGVQSFGTVRDFRAVTAKNVSREAIIYSYLPEVVQTRPDLVRGSHTTTGLVIDETLASALRVDVGDGLTIADKPMRISGVTTGTSAVGKEGIFMPEEVIDQIAPKADYTAVLVMLDEGVSTPSVLEDYSVYNQAEFLELNRVYWEKNASGLAITLMQTAGLFGVIVLLISVAAALNQRRRQMALLRSIGASRRQLWSSEMLYMLFLSLGSVVVQVPVAWLVVGAANSSTPGFQGQLSLPDIITGMVAVLMIVVVFASLVSGIFLRKLRDPAAVLAVA